MAKFRTAFDGKQPEIYTPSGTRTIPTYTHHINKYGVKEFVETGEKNIYAEIQAEAEDSKIENLINRVIAGDVSALRPDGQYIDCTKMPKTMAEAQTMIQEMNNVWTNLPIELRAKYNHSVEEFVAASGGKEWLEDMGLSPKEAKKAAVKEVPVETAPITPVEKGEPAQ